MKKSIAAPINFVRFRILVLLCALCALCGETTAQDFKTIHDGIEYAEVTRKLGDDPVKINLLRLDLKKVRLDVHHALDAAIGTETTSSIAKRKGAVAAINAGFFRLDTSIFAGDAAGVLQIDGRLVSESNNKRIALGISNNKNLTEINFGHLTTKTFISAGADFVFYPSGINRERKNDELILYKQGFSNTTLAGMDGKEIVFKLRCRPQSNEFSSEYCFGEVSETRPAMPATALKSNEYVVSFGKNAFDKFSGISELAELMPKTFIFGNKIEVEDIGKQEFFQTAEDIVAGVPQLIKNGKIDITWEQEKAGKSFFETRHPRTAVAKMKDGKFLMVTVDGRQPDVSVGMNLNELADYLLEIGAMDAMNLDGGGSTTMFLDGKVVNTPSGGGVERKVGDVIVVTLRKKK